MKETINESRFVSVMTEGGKFSYDGALALFAHLTEIENELGEELEFDPVAIRCEYTEYGSLESFFEMYPQHRPVHGEGDYEAVIDELRYETDVIEIDGTGHIIVRLF